MLADVGERDIGDGQVQVGDCGHQDQREEDQLTPGRAAPGVFGVAATPGSGAVTSGNLRRPRHPCRHRDLVGVTERDALG